MDCTGLKAARKAWTSALMAIENLRERRLRWSAAVRARFARHARA